MKHIICVKLVVLLLATTLQLINATANGWSGIFIHGNKGTQIYNPFTSPPGIDVTGQFGIPTKLGWGAVGKVQGDIYLFGGGPGVDTVYMINMTSNMTTIGPPMPEPLSQMVVGEFDYYKTMLCGGYRPGPTASFSNKCYLFDGKAYTEVANYPVPINSGVMILLEGRPHLFGGFNSVGTVPEVYYFDKYNNWVKRTDMPVAKWGHGAIALNKTTALICGGLANGASSTSCHYYTTTTNTWTQTYNLTITSSSAYLINNFTGRIWCIHNDNTVVEVFDGNIGWDTVSQELAYGPLRAAVVLVP